MLIDIQHLDGLSKRLALLSVHAHAVIVVHGSRRQKRFQQSAVSPVHHQKIRCSIVTEMLPLTDHHLDDITVIFRHGADAVVGTVYREGLTDHWPPWAGLQVNIRYGVT